MPRSRNKPPPNAGCTVHDCPNERHTFRPRRKDGILLGDGGCQACGVVIVDFDRTRRHDPADIEHTVSAFRCEGIRDKFWTKPFNEVSLNYARRKGKAKLLEMAEHKVTQIVGAANHPREGRAVPDKDETLANPFHYAFHATATCCRRCVEYWHGIPAGKALRPEETSYLAGVVRRFLEIRLPNLPDNGVHVPPRRKIKTVTQLLLL